VQALEKRWKIPFKSSNNTGFSQGLVNKPTLDILIQLLQAAARGSSLLGRPAGVPADNATKVCTEAR
jgi:hypothetical protein